MGYNIYYNYFEIKGGYIDNKIYTININNSNEETFTYNDKNLISQAIKVNQVGYSPNVKKHFAYIGRWLGTFGGLPINEYAGKKFYLYDKNGNIKFEGIITWRNKEDVKFTLSQSNCSLNGETTLLLDFSYFTEKGEGYYIYVPGIGRSFSFSISNK